ncbi:hypothetical protein ACRRTK_012461 [Alexandromys fortis]
MSSGYSSLEEDAEDFFFTARTSFFRRAPPGKFRSGQPSAQLAMSGLRARIGPGSPSSPRYGQAVGQGDRAIVGVR